jgi:hypothetical protein
MASDHERKSRVDDEPPVAEWSFWIVVAAAILTLVVLIALVVIGYPLHLPLG